MRPLRLLLSLSSCLLVMVILSFVAASKTRAASSAQKSDGLGAYFTWHSPSSLFPPSAIISLTDDNSTFFLARPAAFGPLLPAKGLSGQIWIGSGFGDNNPGRGGIAGAEGELGCSDVPGWNDGEYGGTTAANSDTAQLQAAAKNKNSATSEVKAAKRDVPMERVPADAPVDGTDDHLHHPLPASSNPKTPPRPGVKPGHADIQSLQETAEIAGKVVLLSRGGCGFLEKVKWVQRRGGVALIVGDDMGGGPLVTMYARGDTSNVTIPSIFTSHTTAHLLSKLVPSGGLVDDYSAQDAQRLGLSLGDGGAAPEAKKPQEDQSNSKSGRKQPPAAAADSHDDGWFGSIFSSPSSDERHQDSRRPPSSGKMDWVLQANFEDQEPNKVHTRSTTTRSPNPTKTPTSDDFIIGVQDWRDPDLLDSQINAAQTASSKPVKAVDPNSPAHHAGLKGGSITPGSGEYSHAKKLPADSKSSKQSTKDYAASASDHGHDEDESKSWIGRLMSSDDEEAQRKNTKPPHIVSQVNSKPVLSPPSTGDGDDDSHDGLWVTLTPASMSSSPFFDTLLVLVVSPLVTLTIVYALLLLRSRIRRRRWRAPKSVVDRLPVRTYHTIASSNTSDASDSVASSPPTPTSATPLLHSGARTISQSRARPRSRTVSEVPASGSSFTNQPSLDQVQEKREAGLAEWRRRYGGRQRECVVCLEEYVDGVSRVMSLPCGHEFHVDCITPWLTTRRRTCPICKGDVVRSLGRSNASASLSSPSTQPLLQHQSPSHDHDGVDIDDVQEQAINTRNYDPAANEPVSRDHEALEDLEQGVEPDRTR